MNKNPPSKLCIWNFREKKTTSGIFRYDFPRTGWWRWCL